MNDANVGKRGATAADDGDNGGNIKEDHVGDNNIGGDDWEDVDIDNDNNGVASLYLCLLPIIVEFDGDCNRGGRDAGGGGGGGGGGGLLPGIEK